MKSIFSKAMVYSLIAVSLWSCKKDEDKVVANVTPAGALTASATTVGLSIQDAAKTAVTLTFPLATVTGYVVPVTSTLQFDLKGNNFASAKETVVTTPTYSTTVADLNKMMLSLGATIGKPAELEVRLKSAAAVNAPTYSNVITIAATPYLASAWLYAPGAYEGWDFGKVDSLVSVTGNRIYVGVIKFPADSITFKVTTVKSWNSGTAYGSGDGDAISDSPSAGNLTTVTPGLKRVTVDLNTNTYKVETADSWAIIGDATPGGWDADTDMKYINDGKGSWKITTNLKKGELKFRQNHKWDYSFGLKDGVFTSTDAGNIPVGAAGKYTITFNETEKTYSVVLNP
jgi:hypothetical protein